MWAHTHTNTAHTKQEGNTNRTKSTNKTRNEPDTKSKEARQACTDTASKRGQTQLKRKAADRPSRVGQDQAVPGPVCRTLFSNCPTIQNNNPNASLSGKPASCRSAEARTDCFMFDINNNYHEVRNSLTGRRLLVWLLYIITVHLT